MARRTMITYPTQRLLGVVDDPAQARAAGAAILAAGLAPADVEVLVGDEGRERLGRLGSCLTHGCRSGCVTCSAWRPPLCIGGSNVAASRRGLLI